MNPIRNKGATVNHTEGRYCRTALGSNRQEGSCRSDLKPPGIFPGLTLLLLLFLLLVPPRSPWAGETIDNSIWGELLKNHVHGGVVDYGGIKKQEDKLDTYLKILADARPDELEPDERMAFYINLYNAWTVKLILGKYPDLKSIKELGTLFNSPWKKKIVGVNNKRISLDEVEHGILRPQFKDPRIHFAVNCASRGCPPLRPEPYSGATLDAQLDDATISFLNDTTRNRIEGNVLHVTKIFKWFDQDFQWGIVRFIGKYAKTDLKKELTEKKDHITVKYLDYDWSLNDR